MMWGMDLIGLLVTGSAALPGLGVRDICFRLIARSCNVICNIPLILMNSQFRDNRFF